MTAWYMISSLTRSQSRRNGNPRLRPILAAIDGEAASAPPGQTSFWTSTITSAFMSISDHNSKRKPCFTSFRYFASLKR